MVLAHIVFWHESLARNVADLAAGRRPTPLRGTLAALGERTRAELGSLDIEVLLDRLMAAQSVIRRDVGAQGVELIPYRQGRLHTPTDHLRITTGHVDHHASDLARAGR
jgi:hypothetical protein